MRKDLAECGKEFYKRGFPWGMVTNGYALTPKLLEELLQSGLRSVTVSFDGLTPETHDWMRGQNGSLVGLGVKNWRLFSIFPKGRAENNPLLQLSPEEFVRMLEFIKQTRKEGVIKASYGCEGFLGDYEIEVRDTTFFCRAGIHVASVLVDGSIIEARYF